MLKGSRRIINEIPHSKNTDTAWEFARCQSPLARRPRHTTLHHLDERTAPSRTTRVDWACGAGLAMPAVFDGPHGSQSGGAATECGSPADQFATALDRRYLRLSCCRVVDSNGHARRSDWATAAPARRRGCVWHRVGAYGVLSQCRDAHRRARIARARGRDVGA